MCCGTKNYSSRTVWLGREHFQKFPANVIRNQKYNTITFIPVVSIRKTAEVKKKNINKIIRLIYFIFFSLLHFVGPLQPIQVFLELFLSDHGNISICTCPENRISLHLLGTTWICHFRDYD